jgi:hypothetical protein
VNASMLALYFDSRTYQAAVALGAASPTIPGSEPGSAKVHLATLSIVSKGRRTPFSRASILVYLAYRLF